MKYHKMYYQPALDLYLFNRTDFSKLHEYNNHTAYLIVNMNNPNDSPYIAIEYVDKKRGYICDVLEYNGLIVYKIIEQNVCGIFNLEEISNNVLPYTKLITDLIEAHNLSANQK